MVTKAAGGKITGLLAITLEAQVALAVGDPVMVTGPYECGLADGTKPVVGFVSVANKMRQAGTGNFPVNKVPGDVTVEARGVMVRRMTSGGAFAAGANVGIGAAGALLAAGGGVATIGIALMPAAGAAVKVDVLITAAS
jgi:hypothetical protein